MSTGRTRTGGFRGRLLTRIVDSFGVPRSMMVPISIAIAAWYIGFPRSIGSSIARWFTCCLPPPGRPQTSSLPSGILAATGKKSDAAIVLTT